MAKRDKADRRYDYVTRTTSVHGKVIDLLCLPRRLGLPLSGKRRQIPGIEGSPEYDTFYAQALNGTGATPQTRLEVKLERAGIKLETLRHVCAQYFDSKQLNSNSRHVVMHRRRYLEEVCRSPSTDDPSRPWGEMRASSMTQLDVRAIQQQWASGPLPVRVESDRRHAASLRTGTAQLGDAHMIALRAAFSWACSQGKLASNPALRVPALRSDDDTHPAWTPEEVERFRKAHKLGTMARLWFELAYTLALRRSDCFPLKSSQLLATGTMEWIEHKNGQSTSQTSRKPIRPKPRALPVTAELVNAILAVRAAIVPKTGQRRGKTFFLLLDRFEKPYNSGRLGKDIQRWVREAKLHLDAGGKPQHRSCHGVRHAVGNKLAVDGKSEIEIANFLGHTNTTHVRRYTLHANRQKIAMNAVTSVGKLPSAALLKKVA